MKKKLFLIITGIVLVGTVCIWLLAKKPAEQMLVDRLNEAVSHYTDMNIKNDEAYSLKVSDVQMLVTTYAPEYTVFGVSAHAYTVRPGQMDETLTAEEQVLPICNFNYALLYDEKTDKFYNVKFEEKGGPTIPDFIKANELDTYKLELPDAGAVENLSLKRNSDSPIVISSKDDVENILSILKETEPTIENGGIGTPVRVENIINADFISKENVIYRLFLYEDEGKYFIEQTDNGVYTISKEDYDLIDKYIPYINYEP
ncbi:DUF5301 domain-containing protein [Lachnospiraceae bacterium JLR.KK009]|nr:hypothetical protein C810_02671 [Lachnospiraceae bacterium A2]